MEGKATTFLTSLLDRGLAATYGTASKDGTKGTEAGTGDDVDETEKSSSYAFERKGGADTVEAGNARACFLENAKYFLITLIVWSHALDDFLARSTTVNAESWSVRKTKVEVLSPILPFVRAVFLTLSTFSMPLFTAIAGFQSKSWLEISRGHDVKSVVMLARLRRSTATLLGAWVLWQALYCAVSYSDVRPLQWWAPIDVTWFLLALYIWRTSVLLVGNFRDGAIYGSLIALAITVGFTETPATANGLMFLDWQRVCTYALYFYVGLIMVRKEDVDNFIRVFEMQAPRPWLRIAVGWIALGLFFGAFLLADFLGEPFEQMREWVLTAQPYGFEKWYYPFLEASMRIVLYFVVAITSAAFMCTIPVERYWFTSLGARTMSAYLLHRVFLTVYDDLTTKFWDDDDIDVTLQIMIGIFALPLVVSQLCLSRPVVASVAPLVDPALAFGASSEWLFYKQPGMGTDFSDTEDSEGSSHGGGDAKMGASDRDMAGSWRRE